MNIPFENIDKVYVCLESDYAIFIQINPSHYDSIQQRLKLDKDATVYNPSSDDPLLKYIYMGIQSISIQEIQSLLNMFDTVPKKDFFTEIDVALKDKMTSESQKEAVKLSSSSEFSSSMNQNST